MSPRCLAAAAIAAVTTLALVQAPASAATPAGSPAAAPAGFSPGAPGAGDSYFPKLGNGGYNTHHYTLKLRYAKTGRIKASAKITATAKQNLSRFNLDFVGLKISKLTVSGKKAEFKRAGGELTITPRKGLRKGKRFTVKVSYSGKPKPINDPGLGKSGWLPTNDGAVALSEPFGSASWYPVNDTPRDKASYSFKLTVPKKLKALANGKLTGKTKRKTTTTFRWKAKEPMASYLTMVAIGKYDIKKSTKRGIRNITAVDRSVARGTAADRHAHQHDEQNTPARSHASFHKQAAQITKWGGKVFGRYPFAATGGIVDRINVGYALETQTRPVYDGGLPSTGLAVHELAHQWFGDSASPKRWKDIWLNEGFASYASWLYDEQHGGKSAQKRFDAAYAGASDTQWKTVMADPGRDNIFGWAVYTRGAMTVHAVRMAVGEKAFFKILETWAVENRNSTVTTEDFAKHAEKISGKDLDGLFKAWAYTGGKPAKP